MILYTICDTPTANRLVQLAGQSGRGGTKRAYNVERHYKKQGQRHRLACSKASAAISAARRPAQLRRHEPPTPGRTEQLDYGTVTVTLQHFGVAKHNQLHAHGRRAPAGGARVLSRGRRAAMQQAAQPATHARRARRVAPQPAAAAAAATTPARVAAPGAAGLALQLASGGQLTPARAGDLPPIRTPIASLPAITGLPPLRKHAALDASIATDADYEVPLDARAPSPPVQPAPSPSLQTVSTGPPHPLYESVVLDMDPLAPPPVQTPPPLPQARRPTVSPAQSLSARQARRKAGERRRRGGEAEEEEEEEGEEEQEEQEEQEEEEKRRKEQEQKQEERKTRLCYRI